jgi:hypothetical protein
MLQFLVFTQLPAHVIDSSVPGMLVLHHTPSLHLNNSHSPFIFIFFKSKASTKFIEWTAKLPHAQEGLRGEKAKLYYSWSLGVI